MDTSKEKIVFLIHQLLAETGFRESLHRLEEESKVFFDLAYFNELATSGEWDSAEKYLSAFMTPCNSESLGGILFAMETQRNMEKLNSNFAVQRVDLLGDFQERLLDQLQDKMKFPTTETTALMELVRPMLNSSADLLPQADMRTIVHEAETSEGTCSTNFCLRVGDSRVWKLKTIENPAQCHKLELPDNSSGQRVSWVTYSRTGNFIVAVTQNATYKLWNWNNDLDWTKNVTGILPPRLFQPRMGLTVAKSRSVLSPSALGHDGYQIVSAFEGKVFLSNLDLLQTLQAFETMSRRVTCIALLPQDNSTVALGYEAGLVEIFSLNDGLVKAELRGHEKQITGLAFSQEVLVSSGDDSQLCIWSIDGWMMQGSKIFTSTEQVGKPSRIIRIEFHKDQRHLIAVRGSQIDILSAPELQVLYQFQQEVNAPPTNSITFGAYSCDCESLYVSFKDGSIGVFNTKTGQLRCAINRSVYSEPDPSLEIYPVYIAAHPSMPSQFAVVLNIGTVHVLEPLDWSS